MIRRKTAGTTEFRASSGNACTVEVRLSEGAMAVAFLWDDIPPSESDVAESREYLRRLCEPINIDWSGAIEGGFEPNNDALARKQEEFLRLNDTPAGGAQ